MMPRWVIFWIGGPIVFMLLSLGLYNATRNEASADRLTRLEVGQDASIQNMALLMRHFDLVPVTPKDIKKGEHQ